MLAGVVTFYWFPIINRLRQRRARVRRCGAGAVRRFRHAEGPRFGLNPIMAALLGMLTGIGGGMVRDVLAGRSPHVLRADLYAVAALAGAAVVVIGNLLQFPSGPATIVGAALCFGLRVMAIRRGWQLPVARPRK